MSDVVDIDPTLRALDALADDFAEPGDETSGCGSMWPLLAVPSDALSPLDRDARDRHLARCARCRVAMTDAWLDVDADGAALAPTRAAIPAATALPDLPERRRRGVRALAIASIVAAAASLLVVGVPMMLGSSARHTVTPLRGASIGDERPLDLLLVVEDNARVPEAIGPVDEALAQVRDHVPAETRVTVVTAHRDDLSIVARDLSPTEPTAVLPADGEDVRPVYFQIFPQLGKLIEIRTHRRAIVIIGDACGLGGPHGADPDIDELRAEGIAIVAAGFRYPNCQHVVTPRLLSHGTSDYAETIGTAIDLAVHTASGPAPVKSRAPIDLVVVVDGHGALLGDDPAVAPTAFADVRRSLEDIELHIPDHSKVRLVAAVGDTITPLGEKLYPNIGVSGAMLGDSHSYSANVTAPRYSVVLERARHLLDQHHDRTRALLLVATGCELVEGERAERARQLEALRADGVEVAMVAYHPEALADCTPAFDDAELRARVALHSSAIAGLVFDAVEDFSRPDPATAPADLLHFVHDTLSAP